MLLITGKLPVSQLGGRSFSRLHNMSKDGMSKEGRKMLPLQVTHNIESDCKDRLKIRTTETRTS